MLCTTWKVTKRPILPISVRSTTRESRASDLAAYISDGTGSGGGHAFKAGGRLDRRKLDEQRGDLTLKEALACKIDNFLAYYKVLDCTRLDKDKALYAAHLDAEYANFGAMREYEKRHEHLSFIHCVEHFPVGTRLHARTLQGDISFDIDQDTFLVIGGQGEVFPVQRSDFEKSYTPISRPIKRDLPYAPEVLNADQGERLILTDKARSCLTKAKIRVWATPLKTGIKMFTVWDKANYIKGDAGDWLLVSANNPEDWNLAGRERFLQMYTPVT